LRDSIFFLPFTLKPKKRIFVLINNNSDFDDIVSYSYDPVKGMSFVLKKSGEYKISIFAQRGKEILGTDGKCIFETKISRK
jgi:hypothetical protein